MLSNYFLFGIFLIGYLALFLTQYYYEVPLFQWSLKEIPELQKNVSSTEWSFWHVYTHIGGGTLQIIYFAVNVIFNPNKIETMVLVINLSVELFIMTIFKVWHHQARPFWENGDVKSDACYTQFGNPSGHSSFASFFAMFLFYKYFIKVEAQENENEEEESIFASVMKSPSSEQSTFVKIVAFVILTAGYLLIGYSRFILGVHSANQILYGFLLGLWTVLLAIFLLDPLVRNQQKQLRSTKLTKAEVTSQVKWYGAYSAMALASQMAVFLYVDSINGFELDATSKANILKCSGTAPSAKDIMMGNILSAGAVMLGFGALLGSIIKFYYLKQGPKSSSTSCVKFVLCLLIKVVLALPGVLVAVVTLSQKGKLEALVTMLLAAAVPSMYLATILYSGLELWVYAKVTGEKLGTSGYEAPATDESADLESGTQMIGSQSNQLI